MRYNLHKHFFSIRINIIIIIIFIALGTSFPKAKKLIKEIIML